MMDGKAKDKRARSSNTARTKKLSGSELAIGRHKQRAHQPVVMTWTAMTDPKTRTAVCFALSVLFVTIQLFLTRTIPQHYVELDAPTLQHAGGEEVGSLSTASRSQIALEPHENVSVPSATPTSLDKTATPVSRTAATPAGTHATKKRQMIFHFGPPKTATTSLQNDMHGLMRNALLIRDGFWQTGRDSPDWKRRGISLVTLRRLFNSKCMVLHYSSYKHALQEHLSLANTSLTNGTGTPNEVLESMPPPLTMRPAPKLPVCLSSAHTVLEAAKQQNVSIIYSEELISLRARYEPGAMVSSPIFFENLRHYLRDWDIRVVVTYRRVFDWVLSSLKQGMGQITERNQISSRWPKDGGIRYERTLSVIRQWVSDNSNLRDGSPLTMSFKPNYVFIDTIIPAWRDAGFSIHVMNFHDQRHITKQLLCDYIQDAPRSCAHLERSKQDSVMNIRHMVWYAYNDIVFTAAQRGTISEGVQANRSRLEMVGELAGHHGRSLNKTLVDLPLDCPSDDELEKILSMSLVIEKEWMPEWYASADGEAAHRLAFHRTAYEKREFCSVDMDRLFEGVTTWGSLLDNLNHTWS